MAKETHGRKNLFRLMFPQAKRLSRDKNSSWQKGVSSGTGSWMQTAPNSYIKHCANWKLCKALSSQSPLPVTYFLWEECNTSTPPNSTVNLKPNIQMPEFVRTLLIQANTHKSIQICIWLKKREKASQTSQHVTTTMQYYNHILW